MVHRRNLVTIDADLPPAEIIAQVLASSYTRISGVAGHPGQHVGILHTKALFRAAQAAAAA